jgi:WD40 repeat protein
MLVDNPAQATASQADGIITAMCLAGNSLFVAIHAAVPGKTKHPAGIIMMYDLAGAAGLSQATPLLTQSMTYSHKGAITSLAFATVGGAPVLASASTDGALHMWTPNASQTWAHTPMEGHTLSVRGLTWIGESLASVGEDELIHLWSPATSQAPVLTLTPDIHQHGAKLTSCDAVGPLLFTAAENGSIKSWDFSNPANPQLGPLGYTPRTDKPVAAVHTLKVLQPASAQGIALLAVGSGNGQLALKDTSNGLRDLAGVGRGSRGSGGHYKPVLSILPVVMQGQATDFFVTAGQDGVMFVWQFDPSFNA